MTDLQNLFDTKSPHAFRGLSDESRAKISAGVKANNAALGRKPKSKDVRPLKTVDQWSNSLQADILALMESK